MENKGSLAGDMLAAGILADMGGDDNHNSRARDDKYHNKDPHQIKDRHSVVIHFAILFTSYILLPSPTEKIRTA
jgi:hypothetical protein